VNGVGVVRYRDRIAGQLVPESYRPRTGGPRGLAERLEALQELLGAADEGLPEPLPRLGVEGREDLAPAGVADDQVSAVTFRPYRGITHSGSSHAAGQGVEGADAGRRQADAGGEAAGGGDPDPDAGEGAGSEADRDQVDRVPATGGAGRPLDLAQQRAGVPGAPLGGEPQQRLVQRLAVAPGAGGGVGGRGIEADDDQGGGPSS
jgi:hypothetical protein